MTPISVFKTIRGSAGFTLLEMLLVLTIIGMASILVVPNVGNLESRSFSAQVRQATSLLNYARRIAVVRGIPSAATFYRAIEDSDAEDSPAPARNSVGRWQSYGASIRYENSSKQEIDIQEKLEIVFYPEGGSTGGTLMISREEQQVAIHVDPFTGRITVEESEN